MNQLEKLGIKIGTSTNSGLVDSSFKKSTEKYDPSLQVVRKGLGSSPRDNLESQLSKGGIEIACAAPKLQRVSPHAEDFDSDSWQAKRLKDQEQADADHQGEKGYNYSRGSHGEEFHSDASDVDYAITEVDREFGAEKRPMKSKATRDTYIGDDQGEKQYEYKSEKPNLFLKAIGALDDLIKGKDPVEKIAKQAATIKKEKMGKKDLMKLANLHENSDGVVEKKYTCKADYDFNKDGQLDAHEKEHKKIDKKLAKKSEMDGELDDLCDLIKSKNSMPMKPSMHLKKQPKDKQEAKQEHADKMKYLKSHVKSFGKGGLIFDFGPLTGNPLADYTTQLLNRHADPVQMNNAKYQTKAYDEAINSFVEKGEREYSGETTPFGNLTKEGAEMIDKPMDQQVLEAFKKGQFDNSASNPAVVNHHNDKTINVGSEVIKATSETDAALIEMMKAQGMDLSDMASIGAVDVSGGGAIKVIAGLE